MSTSSTPARDITASQPEDAPLYYSPNDLDRILAERLAPFTDLVDQWRKAEEGADDYGPGVAYDGRDCAEMLEAHITAALALRTPPSAL